MRLIATITEKRRLKLGGGTREGFQHQHESATSKMVVKQFTSQRNLPVRVFCDASKVKLEAALQQKSEEI